MKFCDLRAKFVFTGSQKYIEKEMCKSFYGLAEKSIYFKNPVPFKNWCKTSLQDTKEKNTIIL